MTKEHGIGAIVGAVVTLLPLTGVIYAGGQKMQTLEDAVIEQQKIQEQVVDIKDQVTEQRVEIRHIQKSLDAILDKLDAARSTTR